MFDSRSKRLVGTAIVVVGVIVAAGVAGLMPDASAVTAATAGDWSAMTLVYQNEGKHQGLNAPADTTIWTLSYQDSRHWRKELTRSSANAGAVGSVDSLQGTTFTSYSAITGATFTREYLDAPIVPERWFVPGRDRALEGKGYTKVVSADGQRVTYAKTETWPCQQDDPGVGRLLTGVTQSAHCATAPTFQETETIVYRADLAVPIEITHEVEGIVTERIVVTQLTTR